MRVFGYFFIISFIFYPVLSLAGTAPTTTDHEQCQTTLKGLEDQRAAKQEEYNEDCDSDKSSSFACVQLRADIQGLDSKISNQSRQCRGIALEIEKRRIKDAKADVDKHNRKTKMLGTLSTLVGTGLVAKGMSCCGGHCKKGCPLIPIGLAGIGMGINLMNNSKKLDDTSLGLDDSTNTCVGENCAPPPPPSPGGPPQGSPLGTGLLGGMNTLPGLPDLTNCEPSCPCPGEPDKLPPNCKVTKDDDGNPKVTFGDDKDKDGFGDEELTVADAKKVNQNSPGIQSAIAAAKAPYADMFAELEEDMAEDEELLAEADGSTGGEGFLSGGTTASGRSAASSGSGRRSRRGKTDNDVNKAVQGLMAQFLNKKKKKKAAQAESKLFGDSQIGVAQDNIFLMVHRRYQERRGENEFFERRSGNPHK